MSGIDDKELTQQIEAVLNSGENSKELFAHIIRSRSDDSSQFTPETYEKYQVVREMYEVTGYHLKDLQIVDGKYVTEDGSDLLDVYKEALQHDPLLKHTAAEAPITDRRSRSLRERVMTPFLIWCCPLSIKRISA